MLRSPSEAMRAEIASLLASIGGNGRLLVVDEMAREVQARHPEDNIAIEDISEFIARAAMEHRLAIRLHNLTVA